MSQKFERSSISEKEIEWKIIQLPCAGRAEMAESAIPKNSSFTSREKYAIKGPPKKK